MRALGEVSEDLLHRDAHLLNALDELDKLRSDLWEYLPGEADTFVRNLLLARIGGTMLSLQRAVG